MYYCYFCICETAFEDYFFCWVSCLGHIVNGNIGILGLLNVPVMPQTKMPPCPWYARMYHLPSWLILPCSLALFYQCSCCLAVCPFVKRAWAVCLSVNVNLDVVKGYFVSRREECGQTDDIPASYLDSLVTQQWLRSKSAVRFLLFVSTCLNPSHIPHLLTLCSVGLSLYLQSRFLYTFDNQIIYEIKKIHKNIYIYLYSCRFQNYLWMVKLWIFARWISWLVSWRNVFY